MVLLMLWSFLGVLVREQNEGMKLGTPGWTPDPLGSGSHAVFTAGHLRVGRGRNAEDANAMTS